MAISERAPGIPASSENARLVADLFTEAKREKRKRLSDWNRYYRMVRNKTWSDNRAAWMPSPQSSEIMPTIHTLTAWMTDQQPRMFASPNPDLSEFDTPPMKEAVTGKATDLQVALDSWWVMSGCNPQVEMALWDTFTYGCGILKTGWDDSIRDGAGDATLRRIDPYTILPDPEASGMDDARYIIEARRVPMFELRRRFPTRAHLVTPGRDSASTDMDLKPEYQGGPQVVPMANLSATGVTGQFPGTSAPGMPARYAAPGSSSVDYTGNVLLKELWLRDTRRMVMPVIEDGVRVDDMVIDVPFWRLICEAEGVILNEDDENPFMHAQCPLIRVPFAEIGEFWSIPLTEHLGPAQIALNRLLASMQSSAELVGNPIMIEPDGSGISRTKIVNRPGGRLTANAGAANNIRWLDPPSMSPAVGELAQYWRDTIDRISGISAVARGTSLRRREAAASVDAVQEASFVRVRAVLRNLEEALRVAGNQVASNMVEFYLEPRAIPIIGPTGSEDYLEVPAKHWYFPDLQLDGETVKEKPLRFDVWIQAGSSLPISRQARAAEADQLYSMGGIDLETLLEAHDWPNRNQVLARVQKQQAAAAMQQPQPQGGQ